LKINSLSNHGLNPFQAFKSINNNAGQTKMSEAFSKEAPTISHINQSSKDKPTSPSSPKLSEPKDKVEISSTEMKIKNESVRQKQIQDQMTESQKSLGSLSEIEEKTNALKELSTKYQNSSKETQSSIEKEASDVFASLKETLSKSNGELKDSLLKAMEAVEPKEAITTDFAQKLSEPVEQAKNTIKNQVEHLTSSLMETQTMSKEQVQSTMEQIKNTLKPSDVKNISQSLDGRRNNVSYLLQ